MKSRNFLVLAGFSFLFFYLPAFPLGSPEKSYVFAAGMGQPIHGVPGRANVRSVVNFGELTEAAKASVPEQEAKEAIPDFLPVPRKGEVPPEAIGRWREELVLPPPQAPAGILSNGTPAPSASFLAMNDSNFFIPPDVHGAAGPSHLMVTLNPHVRIQNRTGGIISTVRLSSFWSSTGATGVFDPKVLYDPYAKRWMFTAVSNARSASSSVLMGVSQDSTPTGTWNLYRVDADPTNRVWADYPSMGFNKDWIVVNVNLFTVVGDTFIRSDNYAFNKADLYAGGTGLFTLLQDITGGGAITPALTYDTTVSTMYMLEDWFGNFGGVGFLRLSTISGPVGSEVYTPGAAFPSTANPWEDVSSAGFADFAPQSGSMRKIMCNDARMQNTVYRNGFLWCAHTVFLPAGTGSRSSVQWWKITPGGSISQRGRMDDPSGNLFYAFPSIAVNKNDAVLIGYSRFSAAQFAGGNYAYRIAADPANTLRNDTVLKAGEAKYDKDFGSGFNRWGDYTNTVVDPVNDVDMWTIQEYAAPRINPADRWGTWWGKIPEPSDPCNPDTVDPTINCPSNFIQSSDAGQCTAAVTFSPTASDDCGVATLSCTPVSGSTFPVGLTTVTCIAADTAGNADTCTFTVTVNDTENPQPGCPANISVNNDPGTCAVTVNFSATASDNCPGSSVVCTPSSGSSFPVGVTNVNCVATDAAGNKDSCQFTVTVNDTEPPVASCPANITVDNDPSRCDAVVNFSASAIDNCPGVTLNCNPPSGSIFPVGLTGVECIASDGLLADSCQFTVTVNDTSKPSIGCPANVVVYRSPSQCDSVVANFAATASDNCPGVSVACNPSSGSPFPLGVSNVTCIATDGSGNQDSCTFTVTVLKGDLNGDGDVTPADISLELSCVFLGVGNCDLCLADLNCDGDLTPADISFALLAVFLSLASPCTP